MIAGGTQTFLVKVAFFGGLAVAAFVLIQKGAAKLGAVLPGSAAALADAVNPTKDTNLAYRGASAAATAVTGDDRPLGVQLWEWVNPGTVQAEKVALYGGTTPDPGKVDQLPARGMGDDNAWYFDNAGVWAETPAGAVTGRTLRK